MHVDWSRTKTIFIVTFFVLDLFLGFQLYQKQSENQFDYISESSVKVEDQLKQMEITYPELPSVPKKLAHIIGETYTFSDEDMKEIESDDATVRTTEDNKKLLITYDEPKPIIGTKSEAKSLLGSQVLFSDDYVYSEYLSRKGKELVFIQTYENSPIYQKEDSINGQIMIQLNEDGEITSFSQTYLDTNEQGKKQEILTAIKAINQLFNKNKLARKDQITWIELGYFSLIEGETQVLAPTWLIEVNEERHYYVNAISGLIDDPNQESGSETGDEEYESEI